MQAIGEMPQGEGTWPVSWIPSSSRADRPPGMRPLAAPVRPRHAGGCGPAPASGIQPSGMHPPPGFPGTRVGAQPFGCDEAAVGSLATVTAAGARSRHEIKGPSAVQDEVSRGEWVSVRAGLGPARGRDAVALCRRRRTRGARRRPVDQARRRRSRTVRSRRR